jgi:ankyrin repeat protein
MGVLKNIYSDWKYSGRDMQLEFREACNKGDLDMVKEMLKYFIIDEFAFQYGFSWACMNGQLEVVKYLLTSPDLKEHADIHAEDDWGFRWACENGQLEIVKFLIDEFKITRTQKIEEFLLENKKYNIVNMFNVRDCNESIASNSNNYCKSNVQNTSIILGYNSCVVPLIKTPKHIYDKPVKCEQFVTNRTKSKKDKVKINYVL